MNRYREDPTRALTFTEARRGLPFDQNLVQRVFTFLQQWARRPPLRPPLLLTPPCSTVPCRSPRVHLLFLAPPAERLPSPALLSHTPLHRPLRLALLSLPSGHHQLRQGRPPGPGPEAPRRPRRTPHGHPRRRPRPPAARGPPLRLPAGAGRRPAGEPGGAGGGAAEGDAARVLLQPLRRRRHRPPALPLHEAAGLRPLPAALRRARHSRATPHPSAPRRLRFLPPPLACAAQASQLPAG